MHKRRLELVEKEIDMVIAVSETTKKDLLEVSKIPENKITVVYEGVGHEFKMINREEVENFRSKYKLPSQFVLALGGVGERKNLNRIKDAAKPYPLVISGDTIPYVADDELPLLYNAATVLMYTTLYEGFGLPIIEAMACGLPVLTSNLEIHREVAGEGNALFTNPQDVSDMHQKLTEMLESKEIQKGFIERGSVRAAQFSWEKAAVETAEIYRNLVK